MGERGAAVFLYPREREIDARGNAGRRVDVPVPDPERIVLDAHGRISRRQLAAELPVRGGAPSVQQAGLREQKDADADRTRPPHLAGHLPEPGRQRRITYGSGAQTTDQEHGVAHAFDSAEVMPGDEGQDAAFAFDRQTIGVRDDLNGVDRVPGKTIDRVEHLEGSNEIELIDRGHHGDDDAAAGGGFAQAGLSGRGGHLFTHYDGPSKCCASGSNVMAVFAGSLSQIDVPG